MPPEPLGPCQFLLDGTLLSRALEGILYYRFRCNHPADRVALGVVVCAALLGNLGLTFEPLLLGALLRFVLALRLPLLLGEACRIILLLPSALLFGELLGIALLAELLLLKSLLEFLDPPA